MKTCKEVDAAFDDMPYVKEVRARLKEWEESYWGSTVLAMRQAHLEWLEKTNRKKARRCKWKPWSYFPLLTMRWVRDCCMCGHTIKVGTAGRRRKLSKPDRLVWCCGPCSITEAADNWRPTGD